MFKSRQTLKNQGKADCQPYVRFITLRAKSSYSAGEKCRGVEEEQESAVAGGLTKPHLQTLPGKGLIYI